MRFLAPNPRSPVEAAPPPSITVVIPCYQSAATIAAAVRSAIDQSFPAHEVIVCDDGSTDDPAAALAAYGDRVQILRKANGGGASALNRGIAAASGDLVAILDADDEYERSRLEAIAQLAADRPDLDLVTTDAWVQEDGQRVGRYSDVNPFVVSDQRAGILDTCFVGGWPAIRRRRVIEAGGFDEKHAVAYDWEFWIRLIFSGSSAGMVDAPLMTYRIHSESLSANKTASLRGRLEMFRDVASRPDLLPHERRTLRASIERDRRRLAAYEIEEAIARPESAIALAGLALSRGAPARSRLAALRAAGHRIIRARASGAS